MRFGSGAKVVEHAHFRVKSSGLLKSLVCWFHSLGGLQFKHQTPNPKPHCGNQALWSIGQRHCWPGNHKQRQVGCWSRVKACSLFWV